MEEQPTAARFAQRDELHATPLGRALWQSVRRTRRGRMLSPPNVQAGPYETKYTVSNGYDSNEAP